MDGAGSSERSASGDSKPSTKPWDTYRASFMENSYRPDLADIYYKYMHYLEGLGEQSQGLNDATVLNLDFCNKRNQFEHHTLKYVENIPKLVVRRGQPFTLGIKITDGKFDKTRDRIRLVFKTGDMPLPSYGTLINVNVTNEQKQQQNRDGPYPQWTGFVTSATDDNVNVQIMTPCNSIVSTYKVKCKIFTTDKSGKEKSIVTQVEEEMCLLFNPWVQGDQTYMENAEERNEYVLNDTGRIFVGCYIEWGKWKFHCRPWNFGQFEKDCLEAAFYLLDQSYINKTSQSNPTLVTRALSAMANSNDGSGVLTGNWGGNYMGGTSPLEWNGSVAILEEFMQNKRQVKYGQCWVFSGLLTTLCRALGIPTRSVTNYDSAHDKDLSMTIDSYIDEDCEPIEIMNVDSVWNFHVWNEGWFRRPDLPEGYGGWQAFDSTPQEASVGRMRCGPAPLKALKEGNVYLGYDAPFIFAEMNGDRVTWKKQADGTFRPLSSVSGRHAVGWNLSTKAVGSNERNDVTHLYKYKEGTPEERDAVERASMFSSESDALKSLYGEGMADDVQFTFKGECNPNWDIEINLGVKNKCKDATRKILVKIQYSSVYYTGYVGERVGGTKEETITLTPEASKDIVLKTLASSYLNLINEDAKLKVFLSAQVMETDQVFVATDCYEVDKPWMEMELSTPPKVGQPTEVTIKFTNPLEIPLTNGVLRLEGPGIQRNLKIPLKGKIEAHAVMVEKVTLTPKFPGKRELVACVNTRQLTGITGALEMEIMPE